MDDYQIQLLAKWMKTAAHVDDPDLPILGFLDDLHQSTYAENRIKKGFLEAARLANERVIRAVNAKEYETINPEPDGSDKPQDDEIL